ncbi:MAG: sensor domain-containing diguanylate cyclase [Treponema sp.]|nr:sensor domain-containing diguanylate cyclase [Treponema sp.]
MEKNSAGLDGADVEKAFFSDPRIAANLGFLEETGVLSYVTSLITDVKHYKALFSRGLDIFTHTNIDEILEATVRHLQDHYFPSYIAFIWKPIQNSQDITIRAYRDCKPINLDLRLDSIAAFESFFSTCSRPIFFSDMAEKLKGDKALVPPKDLQPEIAIPIIGPFDLYGIVLIGRKTKNDGSYTGEEMVFLEQFMSFVSQAIKNYLHYEHSLRDIKTGLYNHGFFMTRLKEEVARTKRNTYTSSIIMMDVDRFKNFNDTYGHLAGDQVLESLAHVIRQNVRTDDIPSRFGGEEFTVLLPNAEIATALLVAERLRTSVCEMQVPWEIPLPQITISLGVFSFDENSDIKTNDIIRRADEALYVSKARGRNCTVVWETGLINDVSSGKCKTKE